MFKNESVLEAAVGCKLLDRAIYLANFTKGEGLYFVLEHPSTASSWRPQNLKALIGMDGVYTTTFDQCMYGLKSKVPTPVCSLEKDGLWIFGFVLLGLSYSV